jgi:stromal membrane-associated protein
LRRLQEKQAYEGPVKPDFRSSLTDAILTDPRWASWNLGVFICIRCSGIHRGMGTHISRVKSVDLDSWTDEQLQSILSWGNARANKYWEAKLAAGHVPSEGKIENFIRTKYELKRWTMDGPIPDPATLDAEGDDDVPLSLVKEKQNIERKESIRKQSVGHSAAPRIAPAPVADLMGGDPVPQRATSAGPPTNVPAKTEAAPPKAAAAKESLLGLDFFGDQPSAPPRPASTTGAGGIGSSQSRPDLKQSILSLYASAPRPQAQPQPAAATGGSFGGMASPTFAHQPQKSVGGLNDAFGSLSFSNPTSPKPPVADPFASFGAPKQKAVVPPPGNAFGALSGGNFFDAKPSQPTAPLHQKQPSNSGFGGFGDFASPAPPQPKPAPVAPSALGDLFDFGSPAPQPAAPPAQVSPPAVSNSVFNLSSNPQKPQATPVSPAMAPPSNPLGATSSTNWSNSDVWGNNAWGAPEPSVTSNPPLKSPALNKSSTTNSSNDFGWGGGGSSTVGSASLANQSIVPGSTGGFAPKVAADEEFGGWTSSTGPSASSGNAKPAGGFGASEDLFSNVWQ